MAKFCTQCGKPLHPEFGFCPSCEKDLIQKMGGVPNFCTICGGKVDKQSGICPGCGHSFAVIHSAATAPAEPEKPVEAEKIAAPAEPAAPAVEKAKPAPHPEIKPAPVRPAQPIPQKTAPQPVKSQKPVKQKKKRTGSVVLTILLSILLFVFTFAGAALYSIRSTVTDGDKLEKLMEAVTVSEFLDLMGEEYKDDIYDKLRDYIAEKTGATLTPQKLDELAERSTIKGEIAKQLAVYINDIVEDENKFSLKKSTITDLLKKNRGAVEDVLDAEVSDEVLENIAQWLVNDEIMESISPKTIKKTVPVLYYGIHYGLSWIGVMVFVVLMALCLFFLICNGFSHAAIGGGSVFTAVGGATTAMAVLTMIAPDLLVDLFDSHLIGSALNVFLGSNILLFAGILLLGIAAIVAKILIGLAAKRKSV